METEAQRVEILSLENFNPTGPRDQIINSPRSLEACQRVGIDPEDLFLLTEEELAARIEAEGIPEEDVAETIEQYHAEMNAIYKELLMVRDAIINGGYFEEEASKRRKSKKKRKKRRKIRNEMASQEDLLRAGIDDYFVNRVKDLQKTIDLEVMETELAMEKAKKRRKLLKKAKKRFLIRVQQFEQKLGYDGLFPEEGLKNILRSIKNMADLRKLVRENLFKKKLGKRFEENRQKKSPG